MACGSRESFFRVRLTRTPEEEAAVPFQIEVLPVTGQPSDNK